MPVAVVPAGVSAALQEFFLQKDGEVLVSFMGSLTLAAFEGVPESANGKEVAAKTKVRGLRVQGMESGRAGGRGSRQCSLGVPERVRSGGETPAPFHEPALAGTGSSRVQAPRGMRSIPSELSLAKVASRFSPMVALVSEQASADLRHTLYLISYTLYPLICLRGEGGLVAAALRHIPGGPWCQL